VSVIRVLIVDDHAVVRAGFHMLLTGQPDMEVVGEAGDGEQALEAVARLHPDVVLMDVRMPGLDGIEAARRLTALNLTPPPKVVILTTYDLDEYVLDALRAGACGFLIKHVPAEEVVAGVRAAARGDAILSPSVTRRLVAEFVRRRPPAREHLARLAELTEREREVLLLVARGLSNLEIASQLHVGEGTIKTHVSRVLSKLEVRDRVQAVILAYETGAVQPGYQ
jgi:DNA-binding NarL/FixJ family response regulator